MKGVKVETKSTRRKNDEKVNNDFMFFRSMYIYVWVSKRDKGLYRKD